MKKKLLYFLLMLTLVPYVSAQDMAGYFKTAPEELIPELTQNMRLDLMDFYTNGQRASVLGNIEGHVRLNSFSNDYLCLQTSEQSDLQIKALPDKDSLFVLAVVHTVYAPAKDSRIDFYSSSWVSLPDYPKPRPRACDYWDKQRLDSIGADISYEELCDIPFYEYRYRSGDTCLSVYSSAPAYLGETLFKQVSAAFQQAE